MENVKVSKKFIGVTVNIEGMGQITIRERHAEMLLKRGKTAYLDGIPKPKKLVTKAKSKPVKKDVEIESK